MKLLLLSILLFYSGMLSAQNAFGSLHSNYMPTNSVNVNPTSMLDAKVWLDINIIGAGMYVNNNLIYLEDQSWMSVVRDPESISDQDIGYDQGRNKYHAYNRNFVALPSAVWSQGDYAAGLALGVRSYSGVRNIPTYAGQFIENGVEQYVPQHNIDYSAEKIRVASLNFGEIKGSFAYTFRKRRRDLFMGGLSVTKFFAIGGAGANINQFDFNVNNDSLWQSYHLQADLMYTPDPKFNTKGGVGLDIGFTWERLVGEAGSYFPNSKKMGCRSVPYLFKLGVSIIDIGSVKLPENEYLYAGYNFDNFAWRDYGDLELNEDNVTDIFADEEPNIDEGLIRKPSKIRLPTFASVQFDYNLWASRIYLNASLIQGMPVSKKKFGLRHANSLSVTPRYESYWFEFSLPLILYEYRYPQMGVAMRLGPVTLGTDKLLSWIQRSNLYGADIYAHVKIPIRYHPKCRGRMKSVKSKNGQRYKKYHPCDAYN
ncbi:MAG: DUF5723 family protein [Crocinitomicaceae bacterium]|nr:DUF5723 family protein [Crocinitomicaceae bacterium]